MRVGCWEPSLDPPAWRAPQGSPWCLVSFSCCSPVPTSSPPGPLTSLGFPRAPADTQLSTGAHEQVHTAAFACRGGRALSPEKRPRRPPPATLHGGLLAEGSRPPFPAALPSPVFPFSLTVSCALRVHRRKCYTEFIGMTGSPLLLSLERFTTPNACLPGSPRPPGLLQCCRGASHSLVPAVRKPVCAGLQSCGRACACWEVGGCPQAMGPRDMVHQAVSSVPKLLELPHLPGCEGPRAGTPPVPSR